ncbi:MAG: ribose 5-phosphate isomerase B [Candidatus Atribacteria bacterium]|nr:ribose 5-phosphate isomerase B [Candidatus Atribacteria bacterium]
MKILVGSDHAGFELKEDIKLYLQELGHEVIDYGTHSSEMMDYPDVAFPLARDVVGRVGEKGILCCGTGVGICIAANKVRGVRAANCHDTFSARSSREHNDANILTLGGRVIGKGLARDIVKIWVESQFLGGRYQRRLVKVEDYENR